MNKATVCILVMFFSLSQIYCQKDQSRNNTFLIDDEIAILKRLNSQNQFYLKSETGIFPGIYFEVLKTNNYCPLKNLVKLKQALITKGILTNNTFDRYKLVKTLGKSPIYLVKKNGDSIIEYKTSIILVEF